MPTNTSHYIICNPEQLNRRFYDGFDHKFLFRKAQTLMYLLDSKEQFTEMVKKRDKQSRNAEDEYLTNDVIDE